MNKIFSVFINPKTYSNIFYHIISFPLGLLYFITLTVIICLGMGLAITVIGLPILVGSFYLARLYGTIEIAIAENSTKQQIYRNSLPQVNGIWAKIKLMLSDSFTWKSLLFAFLKFPLGLISFVNVIVSLTVAFGFIAAPFLYQSSHIDLYIWNIDTLSESIIASLLGFIILVLALHISNWLAWLFFKLINLIFGNKTSRNLNN